MVFVRLWKLRGCQVRGSTFLEQWSQEFYGDTDASPRESVHVCGIHRDDLSSRVEDRTTAAAVRGGSIVHQLVPNDIADVSTAD